MNVNTSIEVTKINRSMKPMIMSGWETRLKTEVVLNLVSIIEIQSTDITKTAIIVVTMTRKLITLFKPAFINTDLAFLGHCKIGKYDSY